MYKVKGNDVCKFKVDICTESILDNKNKVPEYFLSLYDTVLRTAVTLSLFNILCACSISTNQKYTAYKSPVVRN